jgi:peptide/nickel transport system substrate-binding protein/microcin C transport system substrate-binding protein
MRIFGGARRPLIFIGAQLVNVLFMGHVLAASGVVDTKKAAPVAPPKGGTLNRNLGGEPSNLHPVMGLADYYSYLTFNYVCDSLMNRDYTDLSWKPHLAEKYEVSKDGKVYTFTLRKGLTFHDGKPITAEDVKFSMDVIKIPEYNAAHMIPYFDGIEKIEVVDSLTIKFYLKDTYFKNFESIATQWIIPKAIYSDVQGTKKMTRTLTCSGPYVLEKFDRGQVITLKRFPNWYGYSDPSWKSAYNFDRMNLRFYTEENVMIEHLKKGDLDFVELNPEAYTTRTNGPEWGTKVIKVKAENAVPRGYRFIAFNFEREMFKDKNVRLALAHMLNREDMVKKFQYNLSVLAKSPVDVTNEASPDISPINFDPNVAKQLLAKAGWKDTDNDGVLDKMINGKKTNLSFDLVFARKELEKYFTVYKEDLKKIGVNLELKFLEWNGFLKLVDDGNFDTMSMGWSGTYDDDPKQIWHSTSAVAGGSNYGHYKNTEVDRLIDQGRNILDRSKRNQTFKQAYKKIAEDVPYIFLFNEKYSLYGKSNRVESQQATLKYDIGTDFWWPKARE